ncbi:MAG TPA: bifunctional ornithine acetyltransferase/N-acetylglutamate synthase, partial [bacterium]|nr:bifunctional ornithine acetyltransferase/N-acetylglutamate synthase [bacterium]
MPQKTGVCFPSGFKAAGIQCGIKKQKKDIAAVISDADCIAEACATTNRVKSYSLLWSLKRIKNPIRAILINSGNANVLGGADGWRTTCGIMEEFASVLNINSTHLLFASTGIIGKPLPEKKIVSALKTLVESASYYGGNDAAEAIMTTDRFPKQAECEIPIKTRRKNQQVRIGAMAKGAGMICPNMATMLAFITTDAVISKPALKKALKHAVN